MTSAVFGLARKHMHTRFIKDFVHMTCHLVLPLSVGWWTDKVIMQVLSRQKET